MLSGLIYKEYIRGYVVVGKESLVLSKSNPFPELSYEENSGDKKN